MLASVLATTVLLKPLVRTSQALSLAPATLGMVEMELCARMSMNVLAKALATTVPHKPPATTPLDHLLALATLAIMAQALFAQVGVSFPVIHFVTS